MCISSLLQFKFGYVKHNPSRLLAPIGQESAKFHLLTRQNLFEHLRLVTDRNTFHFEHDVAGLAGFSLR
jgi:hypothetical protein